MRGLGFVRKSLHVGFRAVEIDSSNPLKYEKRERSQRKRRIGGNARTNLPAGGGRDAGSLDLLFWLFFGIGFVVMSEIIK
jgi:hypothetical protein